MTFTLEKPIFCISTTYVVSPKKIVKKYNESGKKTGLRTISEEQPAISPPHLFFCFVRRSLSLSLISCRNGFCTQEVFLSPPNSVGQPELRKMQKGKRGDPPLRAGFSVPGIQRFAKKSSKNIYYISCTIAEESHFTFVFSIISLNVFFWECGSNCNCLACYFFFLSAVFPTDGSELGGPRMENVNFFFL